MSSEIKGNRFKEMKGFRIWSLKRPTLMTSMIGWITEMKTLRKTLPMVLTIMNAETNTNSTHTRALNMICFRIRNLNTPRLILEVP